MAVRKNSKEAFAVESVHNSAETEPNGRAKKKVVAFSFGGKLVFAHNWICILKSVYVSPRRHVRSILSFLLDVPDRVVRCDQEMFHKFKDVKTRNMTATRFDDVPLGVKLLTAGTAACIADTFTFPLDTAKVRLQVQGERQVAGQTKTILRYKGVLHTVMTIAKEEGPKSLYNGLLAGLQRQMCFASIRLGLYDTVKSFYKDLISGKEGNQQGPLDVLTRISAGITTGALAVFIAQPTDVVKVRFQAQRGREGRYTSTTEAYKTIFRDEGVRGLWKGAYPNVARNAIVNVSEIVCYDIVKDIILRNGLLEDNIVCHFSSAVIAGFCTTVASSPVDVIKTRYMNSPPGQYKSALDCAVQTLKEGPMAFYKGFTPSFCRLVSWNIVMWISYEKLKFLVTTVLSDQ